MEIQKLIQENKYAFPYHYIPFFDNGSFSQSRNLYWGYEYLSYLNFVLEKLGNMEFNSLLDVGCGEGRFLHEIKKHFSNKNLAGIDLSERSISFAKAFNPELNFICGNIQKMKLPQKYDIISLIETLEHIPENEISDFLKEVRNNLNDSGFLILTVPSLNITLNPKHFQHFDTEKLKNTLEGIFKIEKGFYLNTQSFKTVILSKLLSNRFFILNLKRFVKTIYDYYCRNLLVAKKNNAKRICAICKPI